MIFTAYSDEQEIINQIHKYRNEDYALLRMTFTMIDKNNLDCNGIFRDLLQRFDMVNYENIEHGGANGIVYNAIFVERGKLENVKLKFYRVNNSRGDRRFSIETIKRKMEHKEINEGDLLYFSIFLKDDGTPQIYFINLTHNIPTNEEILAALGVDAISQLFISIKPKLAEVINGGFYNNSKGPGEMAPKDVGDTLEEILGISTNNRPDADFEGLIEVKSKGGTSTLDTLFTLRPKFEGTRVAQFEPVDRSRVSAFARLYGYDSDKHPGCSSLYITIGSKDAPQNNQGFYLDVDDDSNVVSIVWVNPENGRKEIAAYWSFEDLKEELYAKHPATLWVKAESRMEGNMVQFKYNEIEFSRAPQFTTFLSLIKTGVVTYDWRGYTTKTGKYAGKNHGNAWRIKPYAKVDLFGEIEKVNFSDCYKG